MKTSEEEFFLVVALLVSAAISAVSVVPVLIEYWRMLR